jgi:hypothetical protein
MQSGKQGEKIAVTRIDSTGEDQTAVWDFDTAC